MHTGSISMPFLPRTVSLLIMSYIVFQEKLYENLR